jgi:hypothetical protein
MEGEKKLTSYSWGKVCTGHGKTPSPNFVRFQEGPKQKFTVKEPYVRDASLQHYGPSNWVWIWLDIKQNHWNILGGGGRVLFHTNLEQMLNIQPRYTAHNDVVDWHVHSAHVNSFSYLFWHTWRGICLKGRTQKLTSVWTVVKLTSKRSTSPGPNSSTFMRHMVQCMAMAGKCRGFITSISRKECVKIIVRLLLSTIA